MTPLTSPIELEPSAPSNVIPLRPVRNKAQGPHARPYRSSDAQTHLIEVNAIEQEPTDERLARRVERVLCALLYHAVLEPGGHRGAKFFSIEKRVAEVVSRDQLAAIARAAIRLDLTADLTRLAAVAIMFELKAQSRWLSRMLRLFSAHRRQIKADTRAIAQLLTSDLDALKVRPIDTFARLV